MTHRLLLALVVLAVLTKAAPAAELSGGFLKPPAAARPWVYWGWINGNITKEGITADLEAMARVGIGGVLLLEIDLELPAGPVHFGDSQWREMFKHTVAEAARLGLQVDMNNDAGWCGSGGPWILPEYAMQRVVFTETAVTGPRQFHGTLRQPETKGGYYRDIAVLAFPTPPADADPKKRFRIANLAGKVGLKRQTFDAQARYPIVPAEARIAGKQIVDLTAQLGNDGQLKWDVPAGKWTVLRLGCTITGRLNHPAPEAGLGLECDKLSKQAMDVQFAGLIGKLIADVGPAAGKTLTHTHIDSWEVGCQNWTRMREEFQKRRGYDPLLLLPVLTGRVVDSLEVSERFLWDLRKSIAEMISENYAGRLQELAHQHGMKLSIEPYGGGLLDNRTYAGRADMPMCEFWIGGNALRIPKAMASAAHTYGKAILGAEAFTSTPQAERWTAHPFSMKGLGDMAFCDGVNQIVFHRYAHQPWMNRKPGMTFGPYGVHYERTETWWEQTRPWHEYLTRCCYLLRQGLFVADLCCLQSESVPNDSKYPAIAGYDCDGCSPEVVLTRMSVRDGRLVLPDGMSYRLLVLPPSQTMQPALLRKIKQLVEAGATVIGLPPQKSPSLSAYPQCDQEVKELAHALWGDADLKNPGMHRCGQGRVMWGKTPDAVLTEMGLPADFRCDSPEAATAMHSIHRTAEGNDIYFVANSSRQPQEVACTFRVKGKRPELWQPDTGRIQRPAIYRETADGTQMPIWLDGFGSVFVVFRHDDVPLSEPVVSLTRDGKAEDAFATPVAKLVIEKAVYGVFGDSASAQDVTARVREMVDQGTYALTPASLASGASEKAAVGKVLQVDYTVNGSHRHTIAASPETMLLFESQPPDAEIDYDARGRMLLEARKSGRYQLKTASGKTAAVEITPLPPPIDVAGPWELRFPAGWGVPEHLTLPALISWSNHPNPGVKYFSGTATYAKTVQVPAAMLGNERRVYLDLGDVQVIAEVKLNGKKLGILWKPPFCLDITDAAKPGDNTLEVAVVNLWVNRLIGDEQLPDDCQRTVTSLRPALGPGNVVKWPPWLLDGKPSPTGRLTFSTWRLWAKDSPLVSSGLLGPVTLRATVRQAVPSEASAKTADPLDVRHWKAARLTLAANALHDLKCEELPGGEYAITTTGTDPYIRVKNFAEVYQPSKAYVLAVEYKSDADTSIRVGYQCDGRFECHSKDIRKTDRWRWYFYDFTLDGRSRGPIEWLRYTFGDGPHVNLTIGRLLLVEADRKMCSLAALGENAVGGPLGIRLDSVQPKNSSMETVCCRDPQSVSVVRSVFKYMDLDAMTKLAQDEPSAKAPVPLAPRLVCGEGEHPENHTVIRILSPYQVAETQFLAFPPEVTGGVGVESLRLADGRVGFAAWPLSSDKTAEIRVFNRQGGLLSAFTVDGRSKPPFVVAAGSFLAAGPRQVLAVTSRHQSGPSPTVLFYSPAGKLLSVTTAQLPDGGLNRYALLAKRSGGTDSLILQNVSRKKAYRLGPSGATLATNFEQIAGDATLFDSVYPDRLYNGGGAEKIVSTLYAVGDGGSVRSIDAGRIENISWFCPQPSHAGEKAGWTPLSEGRYVKHCLYNFLAEAMSWSPLLKSGDIENKSYQQWTGGVDWESSAYLRKDAKHLDQYDQGLPAVWSVIFTHRWARTPAMKSLMDRKDPATGLPVYLLLSRNNEPEGGGYFGRRLFEYGSQNFEQESLSKLYHACQREFLRHLAPHYRKNPEMTLAVEPNHENEVVSAGDSVGDYNPKNIEGFYQYLVTLYQDLAHINKVFGTPFTSAFFDAPRGAYRGNWDRYHADNPYYSAWVEYNRTVIYRRVGMSYREALLAGFPPELIKCHQIPDSYALGNVGISEGNVRISPIDWLLTTGAGFGTSRYGADYQLKHNIYQGAYSSGYDGMLLGEYASLTPNADRAYGQLAYLRQHGVASMHVMWWPTFIKNAQAMDQAQQSALRKLIEQNDTPKPGYAGGIGEIRPYRGRAGAFDIAALGVGAENTGLIKSLRENGSFEGTVYVVPFHAHVDVTTLVSQPSFSVPTETAPLCSIPALRAGSIVEITFTTTETPAGEIALLLSHRGVGLADNSVTLAHLGAGQRVRVIYKMPLVLDDVALSIVSRKLPVAIKDLRVYHQQDLTVCLGKHIMEGVRHRGGVTFDVLGDLSSQ